MLGLVLLLALHAEGVGDQAVRAEAGAEIVDGRYDQELIRAVSFRNFMKPAFDLLGVADNAPFPALFDACEIILRVRIIQRRIHGREEPELQAAFQAQEVQVRA